MKNSITHTSIILILALAWSVPSIAQSDKGLLSTRIGIKGGVNFSNLYNQDESDSKYLIGFNAGLFARIGLSGPIAIQPEIYFTAKGAEVTYNGLIVNGTASFRLNYVEIPLLLMVRVTPFLNIHAGPYAAYLISGVTKNQSNIALFNFEQNIDTNDYNRFEAGIAAGFGIDAGAFGFGARYTYGLTRVGKEKSFMGVAYTIPDAYNGVLNLYISVSLN
jgi:hypothetical protein